MKRRFSLMMSLVLAIALAFTYAPQTNAQAKKVLNVAFSQEPNTLSPYYTQSAFATWATYLIQAHFFDYDNKFKPLPKLAAEVPNMENGGVSKDAKTYTLKLKKGLKWSDGKPLTSADLAFTYEMIKDKANTFSQFTALQPLIDKITVKDETTVELVLTESKPFPEDVAGPGFIILPKHILEAEYKAKKNLDEAKENQNPTVFSGPFLLKEWKRGESMTFVANPDYVLGKPKIDELVNKFFAEPQVSYAALAAGQIDWIPNLQPADGESIQKLTKDVTFFSTYGSYREYLTFNLHGMKADTVAAKGNPSLMDPKVRQAFRLAIDREKLVKEALAGLASVTDDPNDQTDFKVAAVKFVKYDKAAAEKLLDEAGYKKGADGIRAKDGVRMEYSYITTPAAQRKRNQAIIQQDLAAVGIKVNLDNKPAAEFFAPFNQGGILAAGKFDIGEFANNTVTTNSANASLRAFMMCEEVITEKNQGGSNNIGYCNEKDKVDDLQKTTEQALDPKVRADASAKLIEIYNRDIPFIILYNRDDIYVYRTAKFASAPAIGSGISNLWYDVQAWDIK
jgi:peptide/nickel transport system substrate-binding protein